MTLYFVIFFLILLLPKNRKIAASIFFAVLFLHSACRYGIGIDFWPYWDLTTKTIGMGQSFERLEWSSKFLMTLDNEYNFPQLYFIVTSFISISIFTYAMYREAPDFKLSALFFYSFLTSKRSLQ